MIVTKACVVSSSFVDNVDLSDMTNGICMRGYVLVFKRFSAKHDEPKS